MMGNVFYGAAIQGNTRRGELAEVHHAVLDAIRQSGHSPVSEHVCGSTKEETAALLDAAIGPLPPLGDPQRRVVVRQQMIAKVEGDLVAAIFECTVPSLGTGIEIAHAYLRPRHGLSEIPILALYRYWRHGLSSMVGGITTEEFPNVHVYEYVEIHQAAERVHRFLSALR